MNTNALVGLVVVAVVILGGMAFVIYGPDGSSSTASSTPTTTTNTNTTTTTVTETPGKPVVTTGTLVVASNSSAVVTGKVNSDGSQTSYWYEYGPTKTLGFTTAKQSVGSGYNNINAPAIISGLSASSQYYYRLVAENAYGAVSGQTLGFSTNTTAPVAGTAPTTQTDAASTITRTTANLNGHITPNNSTTSYWFEYGKTTGFGNTTAFQSAGSGTSAQNVSVSLSSLDPLTKYYFRINAQNQYGTINGAVMNFTTGGPAAAGIPVVDTTAPSNVTSSSATLRGTLNPNGDATTYWFEYGTDSLLGSLVGSSTHTALTDAGTAAITVMTDIGSLSPNVKYYYQLVASNSHGTVRGDIVTFTTKR